MIKRILVALSGTPYSAVAVRHAIELAVAHDAELTGVTIADVEAISNVGPVPIGGGAAAAELSHQRQAVTEERVEVAIAAFEEECARVKLPHSVVRESGDPFEELISLWRYHDLTVLGLRGLFEYGLVHNPDDYLIRLVKEGVRPIVAVSAEFREIRKVLIAYNGTMVSAKAMKRFVQSHPWGNVEVRIACFRMDPEIAERLLVDASSYCRAHGMVVDVEHVAASAKTELLSYAEGWGADLIVLGSCTKSRMARLVLGDTCINTIRDAHVPLYLTQ